MNWLPPPVVGAVIAAAAILGLIAFAMAVDYVVWRANERTRRGRAFAHGATEIDASGPAGVSGTMARGTVGPSPYRARGYVRPFSHE